MAKKLHQGRGVHDPAQLSALAIKELGVRQTAARGLVYFECRLLAHHDICRSTATCLELGIEQKRPAYGQSGCD
ncbi:hypothetical protein ABIF65_010864 [Bradyrhizobium japonicum]|jgi:hypothetical protein|uniref:hypothetical protein n=1 Tax=Bradyrhizobium TaxID=374 RepID=UPI000489B1F9|nr:MULTISPECIES: hypothetical protein [Bradyrhizobium]MBR1071087.1 hypothetical protein [Bradyrhizobium liaoningense]MCP1856108.1 hypothetical protein [Bradyrhizobium japonicum]MCW2319779.1 hypothetical protein [Bradyrhizobium japonicum]WLB95941.1 hypothetical protein QIH92_40820 [Bradyrhizobium japonicum USDA 123]